MIRQLAIALGLLTCCVFVEPTKAGFDATFTGHSQVLFNHLGVSNPNSDGVINFAVYENLDGGNWASELGVFANGVLFADTLGATITTAANLTANYVYMFQIVNTDVAAGESFLTRLHVLDPLSTFDSVGYLRASSTGDPLVFTDADGDVNTANPKLGTNTKTTDPTINGVPSESGVAAPGFATDATAKTPTFANQFPSEPGSHAPFEVIMNWPFPTNSLATGEYSSVVFLTSRTPPKYDKGELQDGNQISAGDVPVPSPELGTLSMTLGALVCGLVGMTFTWRRKRVA